MNAPVTDVWWDRSDMGQGRQLMTLGENSEVYVWDVRTRRCLQKWKDDGGYGSCIMGGDQNGRYVATG